jgi:tryptophan synthase beta subunit
MERDFGGRYVPETLMAALERLEAAYAGLRDDPVFWAELRELLARFAGPAHADLPGGPARDRRSA